MTTKELHNLFLKFPSVSTDTRKITKDCIFFALKGDNFNGNTYASEALRTGAAYAIIDEEDFNTTDNHILVEDVLTTLQKLASYHRNYCKAKVIGLTGSNGKTTTKELINAVLSKKYKTEIKTLDKIPNEELDELARRNINALWMIGLWERSSASKKIKHIMGNIDAVASAYSLYDYQIAYDIGGEDAYNNLNKRAKERGIRLASDMVPNHTGIHSDWVRNHPEYFVQVSEPPFDYHFTGEDLSEDPNIEIKIEDGYWEKRDAAVVFRRIDKRYNDVRYIYHGNDGTNMPWNDTAQLDMLKHEVREAVIDKR